VADAANDGLRQPSYAAGVAQRKEAADRRRTRDDSGVIPDRARDDTDEGWGERPADDDERLRADRPPHWAEHPPQQA
jgi:hypothetical protein